MSLDPEIEIAIFDAASRIEEPVVRKAFLDWAFRDAPEEARRMNEVLVAEDAAQSWFQQAEDALTGLAAEIADTGALELPVQLLETAEVDDLSQSVAPRYTILQLIGEGSGGLVYLAEQLQPVQRKVAIKLLRSGLEISAFLAAFQREQQILATMHHPGIAAIFDAGTTLSGRPYLVMEWVDGVRITEYCDAQRFTLRQRLDLFHQVCSAIQHAHQKGVIHRDLKPSNILITHANSVPLPKVIDFGIASASEWSSDAPQTSGTPTYMSPEQAAGGSDADTRSDVFSLGVILYELLAGSPPWSPLRLAQPARPASTQIASLSVADLAALADRRHLAPHALQASLRGDLDAIIGKAISLDREQRYDTVDNLASDITRHLGRFPVTARSSSMRYVARCFLTRNRLACFSIATVLIAMLLGTVISLNFSYRERQARKEAEHARANTATLLDQISTREHITRAAILLNEKRIEEADALLQKFPVSGITPSAEVAYLFRFLGERNALLGRWKEASDCFERLMMADRHVPFVKVARSNDLLFAAPAILEAGNTSTYDAMREDIVACLPQTNDPVAAEHVAKTCLLTPPSRAMLDTLRPLAENFRIRDWASRPRPDVHPMYQEWFGLATVLFDLRDGRDQAVYDNAGYALALAKTPSCRASLLIVRAMAGIRVGQSDAARRDMAEASSLIEQANSRVIVEDREDYDLSQGSWYAWAVARILYREAELLSVR